MPQDIKGPGRETLRREVLDFEPYHAGLSIEEIRERYGLSNIIKLASNENPLGVSPVVQKCLCDNAPKAFRYAQTGNPRLVAAIADHLGVAPDRIVPGNGSDEIIDLLIRVRANPDTDNVVAFKPCFSMYELQTRFHGVAFRQTPLNPDFSFPWDAFLESMDEHTALAFVTTPDNPSGFTPPGSDLERLARSVPEQCLLVIDEAYMDFCEDQDSHSLMSRLDEFPNVVILRTFSKLYGLAGLRLGYGVMPAWLADYLWRVRLPFSVNCLAEEAGITALKDSIFVEETLRVVAEGRRQLARGLEALGAIVAPSMANFLLITLPGTAPSAREVFEALLQRGIIIRPLGSYKLPSSLRITVGTRSENEQFLQALAEIMS